MTAAVPPASAPDGRSAELRASARRVLPVLDAELASFHARAAARATCRRGCHDCCYTLVGATLAEAVVLLDAACGDEAGQRRWPELAARLRADTDAFPEDPAARAAAHLRRKQPCVFLSMSSGECTVYSARPLACRVHYVVSPKERCAPELTQSEVLAIDAREVVRRCATAMVAPLDDELRRVDHLPVLLLEAARILGLDGESAAKP